jgi:hypothetical protein
VVYVTRGLIEALLEFAAEAEPERFTVGLEVTPAGEFDAVLDLPAETPIFTHFYHPDASQSVSAVFGMDFSTPVGRTRGRFVSHPGGELSVSLTDDLHATMLVVIPPWERESVAVFDRRGRRGSLEVVDAEPPIEEL